MTEQIRETTARERRELFAEGPVAVFTWRNEPGWPVECVSSSVECLFGYAPSELYDTGPAYAELVHEDDVDRVKQEVEENSDGTTERFHHEPYRMVTKGGDVRWVLDYTQIVREDGEIVAYTGYVVDITERKEQLEYVTALNATIRSLHEALIGSESRTEIHEDVCRLLAELSCFEGVWIGTIDPGSDEIVPTAHSGISESHLDELSLSLDADSPVPAVRIAIERSVDGEHRTFEPTAGDSGDASDLSEEIRSAFAVPISHRGMLHEILTVYGTEPDTFDARIREVLLELGTLVGYAITAVERRNTLYSDGTRNLVLEVATDEDEPLRLLSGRLSTPIEVRSVSRRKPDALLLYCLIPDIEAERVIDGAETVPGIRSVKALPGEEASIYEFVTDDRCVASKITALGASLRVLRVSEPHSELVISVCRHRDQRQFIQQVRELFGDAELKAERGTDPSETIPWPTLLPDVLTEQQQNVLKAAYHAGYFDENRKRTGSEIAEQLGIAQPTFSNHVRAAQRNLLSSVWGETRNEHRTN